MPNYTTNLNLEKPLANEQYNIDVFNANVDKIDQFAGQTPARALTADKLTTGAKINGVNFKGDTDIITGAGFYYDTVTYGAGDLVFIYNQDDALELHKSLSAGNIGHNPLTTTGYWQKQELGGGGGRNIGEIITSTLPLVDAGLHLLDGTRLPGDGIYSDFVKYIADLYDSTSGNNGIRVNPVMTSMSAPYGQVSGTGTLYNETSNFYIMFKDSSGNNAWTSTSGSVTYTYDSTQYPKAGTYRVYFDYGSWGQSDRTLNNVIITITFDDDTTQSINVGNLTGTITAINSNYTSAEFTTTKNIKSFTLSHSGSSVNITTMNIGNLQLQRMVANYFCTEAQWQATVTLSVTDSCGKFVYDPTLNTVRLPKINGIMQGTTAISVLGDLVEAGLPNITGNLGDIEAGDSAGSTSGAFYFNSQAMQNKFSQTTANRYGFGFDASRSSSIYGNSSTVQPETTKVFVYIVVANSTKTEIEVDIDNIATDLNNKVNKSGDTMTGNLTMYGIGYDPATETMNDSIFLKSSTIDRNVIPTGEYNQFSPYLEMRDKNGATLAQIYYRHATDGSRRLTFHCKSNADTSAYAYIGFDENGNQYCSFPNTTCVEGQWVYKFTSIASDVSINGSSNLTYSLSSYLPNDGHKYEILITATGITDTTLNHNHVVYIQTDIIPFNCCLWRARTVISGTQSYSGGNAILPVGTGRTLKLIRNTNYYGTVSLMVYGYRRIGTNA